MLEAFTNATPAVRKCFSIDVKCVELIRMSHSAGKLYSGDNDDHDDGNDQTATESNQT